jgi:predicted acetyltransferase
MILRELTIEDEAQALAGHHELAQGNWEYLLKYEPGMKWSEYISLLDAEARGINLAPGRVRATFLIAEVDGVLVGRSSIRHTLNEFLLNVGGHIGYGVRPEYRGRGYAKEILKQSLIYVKGLGVEMALLTCDDDNYASARVIESQGGVLENKVVFERTLKRRYWIALNQRNAG